MQRLPARELRRLTRGVTRTRMRLAQTHDTRTALAICVRRAGSMHTTKRVGVRSMIRRAVPTERAVARASTAHRLAACSLGRRTRRIAHMTRRARLRTGFVAALTYTAALAATLGALAGGRGACGHALGATAAIGDADLRRRALLEFRTFTPRADWPAAVTRWCDAAEEVSGEKLATVIVDHAAPLAKPGRRQRDARTDPRLVYRTGVVIPNTTGVPGSAPSGATARGLRACAPCAADEPCCSCAARNSGSAGTCGSRVRSDPGLRCRHLGPQRFEARQYIPQPTWRTETRTQPGTCSRASQDPYQRQPLTAALR